MAKNTNNSGIVLTEENTGDEIMLSLITETPNVTQPSENSTEIMAGEVVSLIQENASVLQELIRGNTEDALAQIQLVYEDCQRQVENYYLARQKELQESITTSIAQGNAVLLKKLQAERLTLTNLRKK